MPVRPRRRRRLGLDWRPELHLALTIGPQPGRPTPTDEELRQAWVLFGPSLMVAAPPAPRPWGFWAFSPGVPPELRATRPALYPVDHTHDHDEAVRQLEEARRRWLQDLERRAPT